jgi:hypothetical protein
MRPAFCGRALQRPWLGSAQLCTTARPHPHSPTHTQTHTTKFTLPGDLLPTLAAKRPRDQEEVDEASGQNCARCLGAFIPTTTFIRAITSLLQIRQFARLRSASCSLQGLSSTSTQRNARATPSRDLTLGVEQLVTLRSPGPREAPPPPKMTPRSPQTKHSTPHRRGELWSRHPLSKGKAEV